MYRVTEPTFPANWNNWEEINQELLPPDNHFFTKEDFEVYRSWIESQRAVAEANQVLFEKLQSQNINHWCRERVFRDIRKVGSLLLNRKKQDYDAVLQSMSNQRDVVVAYIDALKEIVGKFSSNPIVDAKQLVISGLLQAQIIVAYNNMMDDQHNIVTLEERNPWCYECCYILDKKGDDNNGESKN